MRFHKKLAATLGATALTLSGIALNVATAGPAAAAACDHVSATNKSNAIVVVVGGAKAYKEPAAECQAVASMVPGVDLDAWCFTVNQYGNQWIRVDRGWIYSGHIAVKSGTVKHC
ncbi:hypothetical protein [Streptomyces sp. BK239]|uniref:hypothetical protein n=1 Tax=Streptomyces sp. BK239 TaxID=2512155 RepID=UPI00102C9C59|nr:hypothetical protein [Streptomyces sp. BK239]RZU25393.1 hypothetical protein EV567_0879 [Streptomyces sp. BK239]